MTKSIHSKWKRTQRRIKAVNAKPIVAARVEQLNEKLLLIATNRGLGSTPMEDPQTRFFFTAPHISSGPVQLDPIPAKKKVAKKASAVSTTAKKKVDAKQRKPAGHKRTPGCRREDRSCAKSGTGCNGRSNSETEGGRRQAAQNFYYEQTPKEDATRRRRR